VSYEIGGDGCGILVWMSDSPPFGQAPGPAAGNPWAGWWQASDGNWYPPQSAASPRWGGWPPGMSPSDERTWAMLSHLSHFFGSWIAQLIIMSTKGKESAFVRDQAVEALNFTITIAIAALVSLVLCLVLIGFVLLVAVLVAGVAFPLIGAVKANRGEWYRYPVCVRLVH
jgi:uncharacterized Tic20 family protein